MVDRTIRLDLYLRSLTEPHAVERELPSSPNRAIVYAEVSLAYLALKLIGVNTRSVWV